MKLIKTIPFNKNELEIFKVDTTYSTQMETWFFSELLTWIRQRKKKLLGYEKYFDIFHTEEQPLTFTNKVKHSY